MKSNNTAHFRNGPHLFFSRFFPFFLFFIITRSYAALLAADLDWIVGPGYSSGRYILGKNHEKPTWNREKPTWNHGSQLAFEMREGGRAGITEKRYSRRVTTDLWDGGGGRDRNNGKTLLTRGHNWRFRCLDSTKLSAFNPWCQIVLKSLFSSPAKIKFSTMDIQF